MEAAETRRDRRAAEDEVEWSLVETLRTVLRGRGKLLAGTLTGLLAGLLIALLWPKWYTSEAVFLPPHTPETPTAVATFTLQQDPSDMYLGMLGSRSVADDVIDHVGLMQIYHSRTRADARNKLKTNSTFTVNKNSLIAVDTTARDPQLAATIANAYLDALYRLNGEMVASASAHRSQFFEEQMQSQKEALNAAEVALKQVEEKTGIVLPEGEAQAGLKATADLQAQIGAAEAKLSGVRVGATENNPQVVEARAELADLRGQLARQQASSGRQSQRGGLASSSALPGLTLEYVRKMRDMKLNEGLYDSLTQQYEKARIAALDPGPQLQLVDRAMVAERKAGPPRTLCVLGGMVLGFIAALLSVLVERPVRRLMRETASDPIRATGV